MRAATATKVHCGAVWYGIRCAALRCAALRCAALRCAVLYFVEQASRDAGRWGDDTHGS